MCTYREPRLATSSQLFGTRPHPPPPQHDVSKVHKMALFPAPLPPAPSSSLALVLFHGFPASERAPPSLAGLSLPCIGNAAINYLANLCRWWEGHANLMMDHLSCSLLPLPPEVSKVFIYGAGGRFTFFILFFSCSCAVSLKLWPSWGPTLCHSITRRAEPEW